MSDTLGHARPGGGSAPSLVRFGRDVCGDVDAGMRREWLVTNGLGGYAYGSLAGPPTRAYHGRYRGDRVTRDAAYHRGTV